MESSSHRLIQAHISTDPTCAELPLGPKCKAKQYDSMDCKPYSTAKYYEAYRPDVPRLVPVCLRAALDT